MRPKALDLFCGAGGVSVGLQRAGFDVTGVDINPQPNHKGGNFVQADALEYPLEGFDFIWASPPCQAFVGWQNIATLRGAENDHPNHIPAIRARIQAAVTTFVIENVPGSPLHSSLMLCGTMFGLGVQRHRAFESSVLLMNGRRCKHTGDEIGVYGRAPDGRRLYTRADGSRQFAPKGVEQAREAMGIDWMEWDELREAIPPAYAEYIGRQVIGHIK